MSQFGAVTLDPTLFDCPKDVPPVEPAAPRGDSGARGSTDELAPLPIGAEFSPEILHGLPDSTEFPFNDAEVYGNVMPVWTGSMRVPDISIGEWNKLSPAHRHIQQDLYLQRYQQRRKDTIKRLKNSLERKNCCSHHERNVCRH